MSAGSLGGLNFAVDPFTEGEGVVEDSSKDNLGGTNKREPKT